MPKVSVIIPVRNGAATIEAAVNSILMQTLEDHAVVIVDDGSTDETGAIVGKLAERDKRVIPCRNPSAGISSARNFAASRVDSEYIAVMDADDICLPHRLAVQTERMDADRTLAVLGSRIIWFGQKDGMPLMLTGKRACREALRLFSPLCHPAATMRRRAFEDCGRYDEKLQLAVDYDIFCRLSLHGDIDNLPTPLLMYRVHKTQATQDRAKQQMKDMWTALKKHHCALLGTDSIDDKALFARLAKTAIVLGPVHARQSLRALRACWRARNLGKSAATGA